MTALVLNTANTIGWTLKDFYKKIEAHFKAQALARRTTRELSSLNDRELQDIGMHRGLIGKAAKDAYKWELDQQLGGRV